MDKPTDKRSRLAELAKKYNLGKEDFFKIHNSVIITRTGVEKIAMVARINLDYKIVIVDLTNKEACIECTATMPSENGVKTITTFGESTPYNTKNAYPVAMAEKRAKARAILMLTEFYSEGVYSEDESDDFKR